LLNTEIISEGLLVNTDSAPVGLEAIAMVLGYKKNGGNILDAIQRTE